MSQLAHEFPEEYARIASLPPSEQNAAERALATRAGARPMPRGLTQPEPEGPRATRTCRDCGIEYDVPADKVNVGSKWWALCGSCVSQEM